MSMNPLPYVGFNDGIFRSTRNPSSTAWALYAPNGELVSLQGIRLGWTTKNIIEYSVVVELSLEDVALGIRVLVVNLDSQLIVLQLNRHYSVKNPHILRMYECVRLLERNFDYITYQNIPRNINKITDTLENYVLDINFHHMKK